MQAMAHVKELYIFFEDCSSIYHFTICISIACTHASQYHTLVGEIIYITWFCVCVCFFRYQCATQCLNVIKSHFDLNNFHQMHALYSIQIQKLKQQFMLPLCDEWITTELLSSFSFHILFGFFLHFDDFITSNRTKSIKMVRSTTPSE